MRAIELLASIIFHAAGAGIALAILFFALCMFRYMQRLRMNYRLLKLALAFFFASMCSQAVILLFRPELQRPAVETELTRFTSQLTYTIIAFALLYTVFYVVKMFEYPERTQRTWEIIERLSGLLQRFAESKLEEVWPDQIGEQGDNKSYIEG